MGQLITGLLSLDRPLFRLPGFALSIFRAIQRESEHFPCRVFFRAEKSRGSPNREKGLNGQNQKKCDRKISGTVANLQAASDSRIIRQISLPQSRYFQPREKIINLSN